MSTARGRVLVLRVVAAVKGGSPDVEASATRIEKFTADVSQARNGTPVAIAEVMKGK